MANFHAQNMGNGSGGRGNPYYVPAQEGVPNFDFLTYPRAPIGQVPSYPYQYGAVAPPYQYPQAFVPQFPQQQQPITNPYLQQQLMNGFSPYPVPSPPGPAPINNISSPMRAFTPGYQPAPSPHITEPRTPGQVRHDIPAQAHSPHQDQSRHHQRYRHPREASGGRITKFGGVATGPRPNTVIQAPKPPEAKQPEVTQPEAIQSEATQPEAIQSETIQPETRQTETIYPEVTQPEVIQPEVEQSGVARPEFKQPEAEEPVFNEEDFVVPDLPFNMGYLWLANRRMSFERKQREAREAKEEAERQARSQSVIELPPDEPTIDPAKLMLNNPQTAPDAQDTQNLQPPQPRQPIQASANMQPQPTSQASEALSITHQLSFSQVAINIGTINQGQKVIDVYAIRKPHGQSIEFRLAPCGSTLAEIRRGGLVRFERIDLNDYFKSMSKFQVNLLVKQLLSIVPGRNDDLMRWS